MIRPAEDERELFLVKLGEGVDRGEGRGLGLGYRKGQKRPPFPVHGLPVGIAKIFHPAAN